jgi:hypothetical protein
VRDGGSVRSGKSGRSRRTIRTLGTEKGAESLRSGVPEHKIKFEEFHNQVRPLVLFPFLSFDCSTSIENGTDSRRLVDSQLGVRTFIGSIGPVENVRMMVRFSLHSPSFPFLCPFSFLPVPFRSPPSSPCSRSPRALSPLALSSDFYRSGTNSSPPLRSQMKSGHRACYMSRAFAQQHNFIPKDAAPGFYGFSGITGLGVWPIKVRLRFPFLPLLQSLPNSSAAISSLFASTIDPFRLLLKRGNEKLTSPFPLSLPLRPFLSPPAQLQQTGRQQDGRTASHAR